MHPKTMMRMKKVAFIAHEPNLPMMMTMMTKYLHKEISLVHFIDHDNIDFLL